MSARSSSPADKLPPISEHIWNLKYRLKAADGSPLDLTLADTWTRVAKAAASVEKKRVRDAWQGRFFEAMNALELLPAGRIIAGAGSGRDVTLFNCFVMGRIEDDLGSIFDNLKEAALTMQRGGGIGHDFSTLRPAGALVRSVGAGASGPVSFMDVWDAMCRTIMSAGQRRGAMMATMRCDHPDIETFIDAKADAKRLRNFNLSVLVTDAFMTAVREDRAWALTFEGSIFRTVRARALWDRIMRATYDYAEPGVIFIDRINARNNLGYCEEIHATNPCVTADTWVMTGQGPRTVGELVGRAFAARVDGADHESGDSGFFFTGRKPILRVATDRGYALKLTADHRVLTVSKRTRWTRETAWVEAGQLMPGDEIVLNDHRAEAAWPGAGRESDGFLLGLLIGDGHLKAEKAVLSAWPQAAAVCDGNNGVSAMMAAAQEAARALPHRSDFAGWFEIAGRGEWRLQSAPLRDLAYAFGLSPAKKTITPEMERASSDFCRGLLRGLFDADGSVQGDHVKGASVRLSQSDLGLLEACQRILLRLGVASTIYADRRPPGERTLPDGRGGSKAYAVKANHELIVANENLVRFHRLIGFSDAAKSVRLRCIVSSFKRRPNAEPFVARVDSVTPAGEADVFDVQVPAVRRFDANGIVVHNCGEQPLPPHGACLLGSINLARLVEKPFEVAAGIPTARLEALAGLAVRLLDNVIDVSGYPLPAQKREAKAKRRIGLGVTGLGDALILCGQRYGSDGAARLARAWMGAIENAAYLASAELAREKGAFPLFQAEPFLAAPNVAKLPEPVRRAIAQHGIRNGCITSIAPTGTISLLAGNVSSGIEPVFDFRYTRRVREEGETVREESVEDWAHALFRARFGPDAPLPPAFVTAGALSPREHLVMQAAVQAHVDSSISKTINCPAELPFEAFRQIYAEADRLGLKGCTTFRPNAVTGSVLEASSDGGPDGDAGLARTEAAGAPRSDAVLQTSTADRQPGASIGAATPVSSGPSSQTDSARAVPESRAERRTSEPPARIEARSIAPFRAGDGDAVATAWDGGERPQDSSIVYMSRPLERDAVLQGYTYKLKWAQSDHAIYVTINDIEHDGRRRPFEIFINTRNLEHYAWTVALTRMISAVFRRGGDISFVAEELKAVFDPQGGQWMNGRYVPSLLAAIGEIVETHLRRIGWLRSDGDLVPHALPQEGPAALLGGDAADEPERGRAAQQTRGQSETLRRAGGEQRPATTARSTAGSAHPSQHEPSARSRAGGETGGHGANTSGKGVDRDAGLGGLADPRRVGGVRGRLCPRCHQSHLQSQSGCLVCMDCGYSHCG